MVAFRVALDLQQEQGCSRQMEAWPSETAEYSLKILLPLPRQNQCKRLLLQCTLSSTSTRHQHLLPCSPLLVVPVLFGKSGHLQNASIRSWLSTGRIPAVVNHCPIRPKADLVSHSSLPPAGAVGWLSPPIHTALPWCHPKHKGKSF